MKGCQNRKAQVVKYVQNAFRIYPNSNTPGSKKIPSCDKKGKRRHDRMDLPISKKHGCNKTSEAKELGQLAHIWDV